MKRTILACALICAGLSMAQTPGYTDKFITVNGLRLHYLDWGSRRRSQPFIMLHGIEPASLISSITSRPSLTADYHVIAIDMRGHGADFAWSIPEGAYRRRGLRQRPRSICHSARFARPHAAGKFNGRPSRTSLCGLASRSRGETGRGGCWPGTHQRNRIRLHPPG